MILDMTKLPQEPTNDDLLNHDLANASPTETYARLSTALSAIAALPDKPSSNDGTPTETQEKWRNHYEVIMTLLNFELRLCYALGADYLISEVDFKIRRQQICLCLTMMLQVDGVTEAEFIQNINDFGIKTHNQNLPFQDLMGLYALSVLRPYNNPKKEETND